MRKSSIITAILAIAFIITLTPTAEATAPDIRITGATMSPDIMAMIPFTIAVHYYNSGNTTYREKIIIDGQDMGWESWKETTGTGGGFTHSYQFVIQTPGNYSVEIKLQAGITGSNSTQIMPSFPTWVTVYNPPWWIIFTPLYLPPSPDNHDHGTTDGAFEDLGWYMATGRFIP